MKERKSINWRTINIIGGGVILKLHIATLNLHIQCNTVAAGGKLFIDSRAFGLVDWSDRTNNAEWELEDALIIFLTFLSFLIAFGYLVYYVHPPYQKVVRDYNVRYAMNANQLLSVEYIATPHRAKYNNEQISENTYSAYILYSTMADCYLLSFA